MKPKAQKKHKDINLPEQDIKIKKGKRFKSTLKAIAKKKVDVKKD